MPKQARKIKQSDDSKQIRVPGPVHKVFLDRAATLSFERGRLSSMSLPEYLQEASAFFEANRAKNVIQL
jgi:hypothetical protein